MQIDERAAEPERGRKPEQDDPRLVAVAAVRLNQQAAGSGEARAAYDEPAGRSVGWPAKAPGCARPHISSGGFATKRVITAAGGVNNRSARKLEEIIGRVRLLMPAGSGDAKANLNSNSSRNDSVSLWAAIFPSAARVV